MPKLATLQRTMLKLTTLKLTILKLMMLRLTMLKLELPVCAIGSDAEPLAAKPLLIKQRASGLTLNRQAAAYLETAASSLA